jgi:hypothetical protein
LKFCDDDSKVWSTPSLSSFQASALVADVYACAPPAVSWPAATESLRARASRP